MEVSSIQLVEQFLKTAATPGVPQAPGVTPVKPTTFKPNQFNLKPKPAAAPSPQPTRPQFQFGGMGPKPVDPMNVTNSAQGRYAQWQMQDAPASVQQHMYRNWAQDPGSVTQDMREHTQGYYSPADWERDRQAAGGFMSKMPTPLHTLIGRSRNHWDPEYTGDNAAHGAYWLGRGGMQLARPLAAGAGWLTNTQGLSKGLGAFRKYTSPEGLLGSRFTGSKLMGKALGGALMYDLDPTQEGHLMNPLIVAGKNVVAPTYNAVRSGTNLRNAFGAAAKGSWAAPINLAVDGLSEGYHSLRRGRELAPDSWVGKQMAMGFHDRSNDILKANENWQGAGGYFNQALDNIGHPLQSIYSGNREALGVAADYMPFVGNVSQTNRANARLGQDYDKAMQATSKNEADTPFGQVYGRRYVRDDGNVGTFLGLSERGGRGMFYDKATDKNMALHELPDWAQFVNYNRTAAPYVGPGTTKEELAVLRSVPQHDLQRIMGGDIRTPTDKKIMDAAMGANTRKQEREAWWNALTPEQKQQVVVQQAGDAAKAVSGFAKKTIGQWTGIGKPPAPRPWATHPAQVTPPGDVLAVRG